MLRVSNSLEPGPAFGRSPRGFTMIELMVTLTVIAIAEHTGTIQCVAEIDPPLIMYVRPRRFGIPPGWIPYRIPLDDEYLALIASKDRP